MNFLKIAWRDISSIFKNRFIRVSVIGIIIVPLLYSLLYLAAFWDPYSRLTSMPVAVVNLDEGSTKDSSPVNYGDDVVKNLKDNSELGWRFVSLKEAQDGVKGSKYYSMFVIPKDFSKNVLSAKDGKPQQPKIQYISNDGKNFLAAQIGGKVEVLLKAEIAKTITKEYTQITFDNLYDVKDGFKQAADGSKQLSDGMVTLNSKVPELKDGVNKLYNGSTSLKDGLGTAQNGVAQLYYGTNTLNSAIGKAKDGSSQIYDGLGLINNQIPGLKDGTGKLFNGTNDLKNGLKGLNDGVILLDTSINTTATDANGNPLGLAKGMEALNTAVNTPATDTNGNSLGLANGMKALNTAVNTPATDTNGNPLGLANGVSTLNQNVKKLAAGTQGLYDALTKKDVDPTKAGIAQSLVTVQNLLNSGDVVDAQKIINGLVITTTTNSPDPNKPTVLDAVTMINNGVNVATINSVGKQGPSLSKAIDSLDKSINTATINSVGKQGPSLSKAVSSLNDGINVATINSERKQGPSLSKALTSIDEGVNTLGTKVSSELKPGTNDLYNGSKDLYNGLNQLNGSVPTLSTGVSQLYMGSKDLHSGLGQIYDGSSQLKNSLAKPEEVRNIAVNSNTTASDTLFGGVTKLQDGSSQLNDGLKSLNSSIPELSSGVTKLNDGSKELSDKLADGSDKINKNLVNSSSDMATFVSEPLKISEQPINPVKNYGTGFTPYFIPLSLWVGAIMMFFVITDKVDNDIKASSASIVAGKFISYGYIGIIQAVLVSTVVLFLGLKPQSYMAYYLFNILMSYVFIAIIQCLIFLLGDPGRLIAIAILILQLTSCAGTFPLEVVPKFFKVINPYMPFTYCVSALREIISGTNYTVLWKDVTILACIMFGFLFISILMKGHMDKVQELIEKKKEEAASSVA